MSHDIVHTHTCNKGSYIKLQPQQSLLSWIQRERERERERERGDYRIQK